MEVSLRGRESYSMEIILHPVCLVYNDIYYDRFDRSLLRQKELLHFFSLLTCMASIFPAWKVYRHSRWQWGSQHGKWDVQKGQFTGTLLWWWPYFLLPTCNWAHILSTKVVTLGFLKSLFLNSPSYSSSFLINRDTLFPWRSIRWPQPPTASLRSILAFLSKGIYSCWRSVCDEPYRGDDDDDIAVGW